MRVVRLQAWRDYKLSWNESEYGGIGSIRLPSTMIWTPDILLYNRPVLRPCLSVCLSVCL